MDREQCESAIEAWQSRGVAALPRAERELLVAMAANDHRCRKIMSALAGGSAQIDDAVAVFRASWLSEDVVHVVDHRPSLWEAANAVRDRARPSPELVLLATWLEHTLNILLAMAAQAEGAEAEFLRKHASDVSWSKMSKKLKQWRSLPGAPPLSGEQLDELREVFLARNQAVHLEWVGRSREDLASHLERLRRAAASARKLVESLHRLEQSMGNPEGYLAACSYFHTVASAPNDGLQLSEPLE